MKVVFDDEALDDLQRILNGHAAANPGRTQVLAQLIAPTTGKYQTVGTAVCSRADGLTGLHAVSATIDLTHDDLAAAVLAERDGLAGETGFPASVGGKIAVTGPGVALAAETVAEHGLGVRQRGTAHEQGTCRGDHKHNILHR
jgi:hypothetical protein